MYKYLTSIRLALNDLLHLLIRPLVLHMQGLVKETHFSSFDFIYPARNDTILEHQWIAPQELYIVLNALREIRERMEFDSLNLLRGARVL